ncbi:hypothetical protein Axy23_048 [Achromobacter phage vB_AxyP_19-32_Axy23]|uniref:Lipoprotein n=1 Tax=Achromobacter phage vB_AxyP_19-32_Axy23 TaxID=2591047 RepID=A0A514CW78_9CAUD|nr:hypothetical protein Axy23_048 [Achromobacter phage vB_AxyP_19-32_Axy23]
MIRHLLIGAALLSLTACATPYGVPPELGAACTDLAVSADPTTNGELALGYIQEREGNSVCRAVVGIIIDNYRSN